MVFPPEILERIPKAEDDSWVLDQNSVIQFHREHGIQARIQEVLKIHATEDYFSDEHPPEIVRAAIGMRVCAEMYEHICRFGKPSETFLNTEKVRDLIKETPDDGQIGEIPFLSKEEIDGWKKGFLDFDPLAKEEELGGQRGLIKLVAMILTIQNMCRTNPRLYRRYNELIAQTDEIPKAKDVRSLLKGASGNSNLFTWKLLGGVPKIFEQQIEVEPNCHQAAHIAQNSEELLELFASMYIRIFSQASPVKSEFGIWNYLDKSNLGLRKEGDQVRIVTFNTIWSDVSVPDKAHAWIRKKCSALLMKDENDRSVMGHIYQQDCEVARTWLYQTTLSE